MLDAVCSMLGKAEIRVNVDKSAMRRGRLVLGSDPVQIRIVNGLLTKASCTALLDMTLDKYALPHSWDAAECDISNPASDIKPSKFLMALMKNSSDCKFLAKLILWGLGSVIDAKIAHPTRHIDLPASFWFEIEAPTCERSPSTDNCGGHGAVQTILRYLLACKYSMAYSKNLGWVIDGSTPDHLKKLYGACFRPDNVVAWAPPQVNGGG